MKLLELGGDCCLNIISYLGASDVLRFTCTSSFVAEVVNFSPDEVWGALLMKKHPEIPPDFPARFEAALPGPVDRSVALMRSYLNGYPRRTLPVTLYRASQGSASTSVTQRLLINDLHWVMHIRFRPFSYGSALLDVKMRCCDPGYYELDNAERKLMTRCELRLKGSSHRPSVLLCGGWYHNTLDMHQELPHDVVRKLGVTMTRRAKSPTHSATTTPSLCLHFSVDEFQFTARDARANMALVGRANYGVDVDDDDDDDDEVANSSDESNEVIPDRDEEEEVDDEDVDKSDDTTDGSDSDDGDDDDDVYGFHSITHGFRTEPRYFPGRGRSSHTTTLAAYNHEGQAAVRTILRSCASTSAFAIREDPTVLLRVYLISKSRSLSSSSIGLLDPSHMRVVRVLGDEQLGVVVSSLMPLWKKIMPCEEIPSVYHVQEGSNAPTVPVHMSNCLAALPLTMRADEVAASSPRSWTSIILMTPETMAYITHHVFVKSYDPDHKNFDASNVKAIDVSGHDGNALPCEPEGVLEATLRSVLDTRGQGGVFGTVSETGAVDALRFGQANRPTANDPIRGGTVVYHHPTNASRLLLDLRDLLHPSTVRLSYFPSARLAASTYFCPHSKVFVVDKPIDTVATHRQAAVDVMRSLGVNDLGISVAVRWRVRPGDWRDYPHGQLLAYVHYVARVQCGPSPSASIDIEYDFAPEAYKPPPVQHQHTHVVGVKLSALEVERRRLQHEKDVEERQSREEAERKQAIPSMSHMHHPTSSPSAPAQQQPKAVVGVKLSALEVERRRLQHEKELEERQAREEAERHQALMLASSAHNKDRELAVRRFKDDHKGTGTTTATTTMSSATTSSNHPSALQIDKAHRAKEAAEAERAKDLDRERMERLLRERHAREVDKERALRDFREEHTSSSSKASVTATTTTNPASASPPIANAEAVVLVLHVRLPSGITMERAFDDGVTFADVYRWVHTVAPGVCTLQSYPKVFSLDRDGATLVRSAFPSSTRIMLNAR